MMKKSDSIRLLTFLALFLVFSHAFGQNFGGTPNRIKYTQIDNDTVQVIFPIGLDYWGQRVANLSMYQASMSDSSLSTPPIKTTIIIRNLTTISNGFVAYAPYRSEYFTSPPFSQFSGVSPWLDLLHIHEYRHILQESKVMVGRKWAPEHILFGQYGWSGVNFALLPNWYFEGDAVKTETLYTLSGRGRVPLFYLQIPALRSHGNKYSFEKIRSGSFKDPVPSHYVLGYHMTSYMEMEKGSPAWDRITTRSIKKYALISRSSKKLYGLTNRDLYSETVNHLDSIFDYDTSAKDSAILNFDPKNFTSYELPKLSEEGNLIYLKSTYKAIPGFYTFDGQKEKKLFEPGMIHSDHWFDIHENKIIWAEYVPNLIWQNEDYSSLKIFDLDKGKVRYLGKKKRKFFYPLWSEDGNQIGVIEFGENTRQSIILLDEKAKEIKRLEIEEGVFISAIIKVDGYNFWVIKNKDEQSQIVSINIETNQEKALSPRINAVLRHPITDGNHIFFSTTVGILEQIIRLNVLTKQMDVMTDAPFRALDPLVSNNDLYYVSYEGIGYAIRKKELSAIESFKIEDPHIAFYEDLEKEKPSILKDIPTIKYKTSPYKRSTEFLQIHSWIPQFIPPNFGLTLLLQNKIGTFQGELTYVYNTNEGASQFSARLNYAQIYPKLFIGASHTLNRSANQVEFPFDNIPGNFYGRNWSETDFELGAILPFYLTRGKWHRFLSFEASAHYLLANLSEDVHYDTDLEFPYENTRLYYYNLKRKARRQINPQWGQSILLDQSRSFDPNISSQFYFLSTFYFPGLFKTHSLSISPYYMYKPIDNQYDFLDAFPSSYGYLRYRAQNSYRILIKYTMPIWYPDLGIPGLAFFQRIFGSVFYDQSRFTWPDFPDIYQRSLGLELNLDMVVFRIYPLRIGVRGFYLLDPEEGQDPLGWEFLFFGFSF